MNLDQNIHSASKLAKARRWASSFGVVALLLNLIAGPASAGTYDGAMGRTTYVAMTGDVNGDGQNDVLMKAVPKIAMIPIDDDLDIPIPIPVPSPTFALISTTYGIYTLVVNPSVEILNSVNWAAATQQVTFADASGSYAGSVTITAASSEQASFVVSMAADTGQLQVTGTTAPAVDTTSSALPAPIPVVIDVPHLNNADAGTLPGSLSVTPSGAAAYSIPLVVPPGSAGVQPSLSLNYSSSATNGLVGLGWSLGGLSSIHRCGKTIAQDGANARIAFDNEDRLCMDGQRLVLVNLADTSANYWAEGAQFRTEIDSLSRITAVGSLAERSFTVEAKDGRILKFGTATGRVAALSPAVAGVTQPAAKSGPQSWALDTVADRSGNRITYEYTQDAATGEHKPNYIRYGNGTKSHAAVEFIYEARDDRWKRYIDETRNDLVSRLSAIKTHVGDDMTGAMSAGAMVREYKLVYEKSPTSGRSLLASVQATARNPDTGVIETMPATKFDWGKPVKAAGFVSKGIWQNAPILTKSGASGGWEWHPEYFAITDFGKDGRADVLEKRIAPPGGSNPPTTIDGKSVGAVQTQYRYFHNNGNGFDTYTYKLSTGSAFAVLDIADFNGDGSPDLVVGNKVCLSPLGGTSNPGDINTPIVFNCDNTYKVLATNDVEHLPYLVDVVGDGRSGQYTQIQIDGRASLCLQTTCVTDEYPPAILSTRYGDDGTPWFQLNSYVGTTQMVDFAGIGKPYDVRFSQARYVEYVYYDGQRAVNRQYENLQPVISMTGFNLPGPVGSSMPIYVPGAMQSFVYPKTYPSPLPSKTKIPYQFEAPSSGGSLSADFSGSGYNGLAFGFLEVVYPVSPAYDYPLLDLTICQSTGRALDCAVRKKYSGRENYRSILTVGNFVGDGAPSILAQPMKYETGKSPVKSGLLEMCRVMGDDTTNGTGTADANMQCEPWPGVTLGAGHQQPHAFFADLLGTGRTQLLYHHGGTWDANGVWQEVGRWEVFDPIDRAADNQALDRIHQVTNGLGAVSSVEYVDGLIKIGTDLQPTVTQSGDTDLATTYPQHLAKRPGKVVRKLVVGNGEGRTQVSRYQYSDAATDVAGRGALGFGTVTEIDEDSGITMTTRYSHKWPYTGMVRSATVLSSNGITLSATVNTPGIKTFTHTASGRQTLLPFTETSVVTGHDLDGSDLGVVTTVNTLGDVFGNITGQTVTSSGGSKTFVTTSTTSFENNTSTWLIGLAKESTISKTDPDTGTLSRKKNFYYDTNGLLSSDVVEKDNLLLKLTTTYTRNSTFGLVKTVVQDWLDPKTGTQTSRTVSDTDFEAKGRFPLTIKNALNHVETHAYYEGTGARRSLTGPNQLKTTWTADGFGRIVKELRADGNETRNYVKACNADCPSGAKVIQISEHFKGLQRTSVAQVAYSDEAGHQLRTKTWGFNGSAVIAEQEFDSIGRLWKTYHPRFEAGPQYLASRSEYDARDRVVKVTTLNEAGAEQFSTTTYEGLITKLTNPLSQTRTDTRNVIGQLVKVDDAAGGSTKFTYDPFGNLSTTTDPRANVITVLYDNLGRKTVLIDPDLGRIEYSNDPVGRVWSQSTAVQRALGQKTEIGFDALDRMISRTEGDLRSTWVYDTAVMGIGQLALVYTGTDANRDYQRVHQYDELGRALSTKQTLSDGNYYSTLVYDGFGRVVSQNYKRGDLGVEKKFTTRYNDKGYASSFRRGSLVLSELKEQDAAGRAIDVVLGNGLRQTREFNQYTGRMAISHLNLGVERRLQEGYQYNAIGSVSNRSQYWEAVGFGFQEEFLYDNLNRIKSSEVVGQPKQIFEYFSDGSIKNKTGVGTGDYVYPTQGAGSVRPHAVNSIPGLSAFAYDDNGNLLTGAGRTVTWNSFDMPKRISKGTVYSEFVYGPEHQRTRQDRSDGSSIIYAGAQEVETKAGVVTVKTYWPNGLGVEIEKAGQQAELNWTHVDRLGSPIAITGSAGELKEKLAYDAWGKRRSAVDGGTPDSVDGVVDNKGFTNHEMLDQLDLVHMNGRVYDPFTAKFMSGDPLIQDPTNGQNYNRYSYVFNNPTNLTDPTGFAAACGAAEIGSNIKRTCNDAEKAAEKCTGPCTRDRPDKNGKIMRAVGDGRGNARKIDVNNNEQSDAKQGAASPGGSANRGPKTSTDYRKLAEEAYRAGDMAAAFKYRMMALQVQNAGAARVMGLANPGTPDDEAHLLGAMVGNPQGTTPPIGTSAGNSRKNGGITNSAQTAESRAEELHGALDPRAQRHRTTAVTETQEGIRVVSSSNRRLAPEQRALLKTNEVEGVGVGHAEVTGVNAAKQMNLTPTGTAASRPICTNCAGALNEQKIEPLSPLK